MRTKKLKLTTDPGIVRTPESTWEREARHKKYQPTPEQQAIVVRIVQLKGDAMKARLFKTGHALEEAVKAVGWELAEGGSYLKE